MSKRDRVADDSHSSREQSRSPGSSNSTANNQHGRVDGESADNGAEFEDKDGGEIGPFDVEVGIDFSEGWLEGGCGKEVGGAIPADIVEGVEDGGDFGYCGCWIY